MKSMVEGTDNKTNIVQVVTSNRNWMKAYKASCLQAYENVQSSYVFHNRSSYIVTCSCSLWATTATDPCPEKLLSIVLKVSPLPMRRNVMVLHHTETKFGADIQRKVRSDAVRDSSKRLLCIFLSTEGVTKNVRSHYSVSKYVAPHIYTPSKLGGCVVAANVGFPGDSSWYCIYGALPENWDLSVHITLCKNSLSSILIKAQFLKSSCLWKPASLSPRWRLTWYRWHLCLFRAFSTVPTLRLQPWEICQMLPSGYNLHM